MYSILSQGFPVMQKLKQGGAVIIIFFITTIILFIGLCVMRSYSFSADIVNQQHYYWKRYYQYEGCVEYALAYFYKNDAMTVSTIPYSYKRNNYKISITVNDHTHKKNLFITIEEGKKAVATAHIVLEKDALLWVVKNRTLTIQSAIDLDKKALLSYTKLLKN